MEILKWIGVWRFHLEDLVIGFRILTRQFLQSTSSLFGATRTSVPLTVFLPEIDSLLDKQMRDVSAKESENWYWGEISEDIKIAISDARQIISSFHNPHKKTINLDLTLAALYLKARTYSRSALDEHGFITATILEIFRGISDLQTKLNGHCQFQSADIETGTLQTSPVTLYWIQLDCRLRAAIYDIYPYLKKYNAGHNTAMDQFKNLLEGTINARSQNTELLYLSYVDINKLEQPVGKDTIHKLFWLAERMRRQQKKGWKKIMLHCAKSDRTYIETLLAHLVLHIPQQVKYMDTRS